MLELQAKLAEEYKYKKLPPDLSAEVIAKYIAALPSGFKLDGEPDIELYTLMGTRIAKGYTRIVVGDYGAFIEIPEELMDKTLLMVAPGQAYRINDKNFCDRVKYYWFTISDGSAIKIYLQKRTVVYADYRPGMFYVSPHEVRQTPF